ncbi:GNAT family N-acetyltransferase [Flavobacterium sp. J49]|uniref:GNAT family N-acetyltransferase n=1 Tax=Flavobacterium sp. J49 TaxID=2718534 RepID=UPI0015936785|nr:GNAT family N-acetyltransferase [Flavobacterium sp. J49]MBF6640016.1 GNAT family N-acetyltransferase [Flavobacterium sp. J49]NIC01261.1 GNAT family N-acetyltransferase [Flavobacterium sp. J49]
MLQLKTINFDEDMPQIIELTKGHLDDNFNESFFLWKHLQNPFGVSFAMGAWDSDQLVGLRLFMRWEFVGSDNAVIKAIRPVDTVTHNDYRGQGVFKSLTLKGLELNQNNNDLVFNTPNQNSLPGYLKMGWQKIALPHTFIYALVNPFSRKLNAVFFSKNSEHLPEAKTKIGQTFLSKDYLKWRYQDNSFRYIYSDDAFVIYKTGSLKGLKTALVYEISGENDKVASLFSSIACKEKLILFYGYFGSRTHDLNFKMIFKRNTPVVVWRDDKKAIHSSLQFSLGDLEGKL